MRPLSPEVVRSYKNALLPTLVISIIFFINYTYFGIENTLIGPFATLSFLRFKAMNSHYGCILRHFLIYLLMSTFAYFAVSNIVLCLIINALVMGWIGYFLIDEYDPTNYFPAGMALIFFQIAPVHTLPALCNRVEALSASFLIIVIFILLLTLKKGQQNPVRGYIEKCFANCEEQLELCRKGNYEKLDDLHHELYELNRSSSMELYHYNRASIRFKGRMNWYCQFIVLFQVFNYLTIHCDVSGNIEKASDLLTRYHKTFQTVTPPKMFRRLNFRSYRPDLRNFRLRFALRLMIVMTPCFLFAQMADLDNAYWLVISVFFMMIPFSDETLKRVRHRLTGTLIGIVISFILFSFFTQLPAKIAIMTLANFMIYSANSYGAMVAYITCSVLALQSLDASVDIILVQRLLYTCAGGVIAILANRLVFRVRQKKQIEYLIELLASIRRELSLLSKNESDDIYRRRYMKDKLIIKSYMISKRIETLNGPINENLKIEAWEKEKQKHMRFLAEYLGKYILNE